jgi:hypothetical protein
MKDATEMEVGSLRIGRMGEEYAYEHYKDKFNNVEWIN